jgi:predicted nucleic acid-binding protein
LTFVLDTSVSMAWCFTEELDEYAQAVLDALGNDQALVPQLWPLETANVLVLSERKRRLTEKESQRYLSFLSALPIIVDIHTSDRATASILSAARQSGLTAYDAAYLELALREAIPIATRDKAVLNACKKAGIKVFQS